MGGKMDHATNKGIKVSAIILITCTGTVYNNQFEVNLHFKPIPEKDSQWHPVSSP